MIILAGLGAVLKPFGVDLSPLHHTCAKQAASADPCPSGTKRTQSRETAKHARVLPRERGSSQLASEPPLIVTPATLVGRVLLSLQI